LWAVHQIAKHLEPFCVARAAGITSVSQGTTEGVLRHYPHLTADRGLSIPYGAEPDVYDRVRAGLSSSADLDSPRTLLYLGAMWEAAYPTLRAFLAALRQLKEREPALYANCRVNFVGTSYAPDAAADRKVAAFADAAGVSDAVSETPHRLPFLEAVAALASADTLLMLGSSEAHYTPSRLLPYVFARRPMLALMHESSDAVEHLRQRDAVRLIAYNAARPPGARVEEIYDALRSWASDRRCPDLPVPGPEWNPYTTRVLTGRLASFLDDLVDCSGRAAPHTSR
jgi:hypothetical protein